MVAEIHLLIDLPGIRALWIKLPVRLRNNLVEHKCQRMAGSELHPQLVRNTLLPLSITTQECGIYQCPNKWQDVPGHDLQHLGVV